jgi:tRNA (uracil-5-)-methyltransferase TRM9
MRLTVIIPGVDPSIAGRLIELNHQFYQTFAGDFSATRQRIQPGVRRILESLAPSANILDLGCGNGQTWQALRRLGHQCHYTGLDFSPGLLQAADKSETGQASFIQCDLSEPAWASRLPDRTYPVIFAFAVLHHLPGQALRLQTLRLIRGLLAPGGRFYHSEWQFLNSPRLRLRIQPWQSAGLDPADVDVGDALLDWRRGGSGLRYVHHFDEPELATLAAESGFRVLETFYSDGIGGKLGLYQVWESQD